MIRTESITLVCPACLTALECDKVVELPSLDRRTTDFREVYPVAVLPNLVHQCPCGFAGLLESFHTERLPLEVRDRIAELQWNVRWALKSGVERYYHALKCAEWQDTRAVHLGRLALTGAWCAVEADDWESERWFRRRAVDHYQFALKYGIDGVPFEQRGLTTYLVGELYRRLGNSELAEAWFRTASEDEENDAWVLEWAYRQRTNPKEFL